MEKEEKDILNAFLELSLPIRSYSKNELLEKYNSISNPTVEQKNALNLLMNEYDSIQKYLINIDSQPDKEKKYDDEIYLKKWKQIQSLVEAQKHQQYIAGICLVLSFLLIPLIIGILMMITISVETKKINSNIKELIYMSVVDGEIYSIEFFTQYIEITAVYSSLNDLFKTKLKGYKLSANKLYIERN